MPQFELDAWHLIVGLVMFVAGYWAAARPRKKRYFGQTFDDHRPATAPDAEALPADIEKVMTTGARVFTIGFLSVWLTGWTVGVYFAATTWMTLSYGDEGFMFLLIWLGLAVPAWFLAAHTLLRLLRGENVQKEFDGDGDGD